MFPKKTKLISRFILVCCLMICSTAQSGELGNRVWHDLNSNGIQDRGEPGISGTKISLFECNSTTAIATSSSDSLGKFLFSDLPEAYYQLNFEATSGFQFTTAVQGAIGWSDSDPDPQTGTTPCILVRESASILGLDAGLILDSTNNALVNIALNKNSEQSSTSYSGISARAVDGNLNGRYRNGSITHTQPDVLNPWWQVDLSEQHDVSSVVLYNRTDNCCTSRLKDIYVFVSTAPFGDRSLAELTADSSIDSRFYPGEADESLSFDFSTAPGRYVRVQLAGNATLSLAEVEVLAAEPTIDPGGNSDEKKNVLFIMVDDLRPELGVYGVNEIRTPGIDELAQQGVVFNRAYSQFSTCSPSRTSLMTGLRPDTTKVTDLTTNFRDTIPGAITLPQYFKQEGYRTQSFCKVFHGSDLSDPESWTEEHQDYFGTGKVIGPDGKSLPFVSVDKPDDKFSEYGCATLAIDAIGESQAQDTPFFIAVGFRKPHLPFIAPKPYFDMYDKYAIPEASNLFQAFGAPSFAFENLGEIDNYSGIPESASDISEDMRRDLKHGYYAAVSFVDSQVQRLLDQLDSAGLSDNTVVVLLGDHGFHLGEQNDWGKHTNFEVGSRVPLIIKAPGKPVNTKTDALVELVDLFPTVVELAGLSQPTTAQHGGYSLEGNSLVEFIDSPTKSSTRGAFSQWTRSSYKGVSVRTDRWRFTQWVHIFNGTVVNELYDHIIDPSETLNVASYPQYAETVAELTAVVAAGGQAELPQKYQ